MLDIKRLRYLDAIYRYKNFTRASEELYVSQPAISAAVSTLEKELGVKLILRNSKEVTFTFDGEQFMLHARRILKECDETERLMEDIAGKASGTLHLGCSPTLGARLLPHLYSNFFPKWDGAVVHLNEGSMMNHVDMIQKGLLDLSYNALPPQPDLSVLKLTPITTAQIYVVMLPDHPLAQYDAIPIEKLEGEPVCMLDESSRIRALMMENFERKGVVPNIVSYHEQIMCMFHMIQFGNYIGFTTAEEGFPYFPFGDVDMALRPFAEPIVFETGFITKAGKHLPKITRDLISFTKNTLNVWGRS